MITSMKTQTEIINDSIVLLQTKQKQDLLLLKIQINNTTESLKPINLLKTARTQVLGFVKKEGNVFNRMIALGTKEIGYKISGAIVKNPIIKFLEKIFIKKLTIL